MQTLEKSNNSLTETPRSKWQQFFSKLQDHSASHLGLSLVRISFFAVVFASLFEAYQNRFITFIPKDLWVANYILPLNLLAVTSVILGFKTRISALINCVLFRFLVFPCLSDYYHFDFITGLLSFVFLFAPAPKTLSVDSWLRKENRPFEEVPFSFVAFFTIAVGLTYFDSVLFKMTSTLWKSGQMFWVASALPHVSTGLFPQALEINWFVKLMTYGALVFETFFVLILFKYVRPVFCLMGIVLHLGIALFMPIPHFGYGMAGLFFLYVNYEFLAKFVKIKVADSERKIERQLPPALVYGISGLMLACQFCLLIGEEHRPQICFPLANIMSLYRHPLYLDGHFRLPYPICRFETEVDGKKYEIPTFTREGHPIGSGRYWASTSFFMRAPIDEDFIRRYVKGWFSQQNLAIAPVKVYCRDVSMKIENEPDFNLDNQMQTRPWEYAGTMNGDKFEWDKNFLAKFPANVNDHSHEFPKVLLFN